MKIGDVFSRANRIQRSRMFKIVATCIVALLAVGGAVAYAVAINATAPVLTPDAQPANPGGFSPEQAAHLQSNAAKTTDIINGILAAKQDPTSVAVGIALAAGLAIAIIWLDLGLTYLGLGAVALAVIACVRFFHVGAQVAPLLIGLVVLTASFTVLMRLLAMLLAAPWPVFAIARNVLNEAVRMKISMVFIVMLIFGLAALPSLLEEKQFLRYRVQAFLQYGTAGAFWLIAILVLVFSAATVTFEQRDKVIWQTMTKPVAAWQYILGKWLGVVGLAGVLLAVSASGIFLFTEHLRGQPATGERAAYIADEAGGKGDGSGQVENVSQDRFILETQVLTARESVRPDAIELDLEQFKKNVEDAVQAELRQLSASGEREDVIRAKEDELRAKMREELPKAVQRAYLSIAPERNQAYTFSHLERARESNNPIMVRFKINAGSNSPDALYRISIFIQNEGTRILECPLGQFITLQPPLLPTTIDANGKLVLEFINGDVERHIANPETISFPPDGLEVSYSVGGYRANFVRVMSVLWVKLAFLSMLAICASTFLSFPVACLVAFTVFLSAEGSGFILESLDSYTTEDRQGNAIIFNTIINYVALAVASLFKFYSDLRPTGRLVDGIRLSWGQVAGGTGLLALLTGVLYAAACIVFRKRELATYSGQ